MPKPLPTCGLVGEVHQFRELHRRRVLDEEMDVIVLAVALDEACAEIAAARVRDRAARLKARNARVRAHVAHEASTAIASRYGMVAIEDLRIRSMTRSARGTVEAPGANVRAKAGLNRSILNVGWHAFEVMLAYKLEAAGGTLAKVAPRHTSQTCSSCGALHPNSRKNQALFVCELCGGTHNADINAARNILARAHASAAWADDGGRTDCCWTWRARRQLPRKRQLDPDTSGGQIPVLQGGEDVNAPAIPNRGLAARERD